VAHGFLIWAFADRVGLCYHDREMLPILLFRPNEGSQLRKRHSMDFGFTRLTDTKRPNDASRNGQTILQVTWWCKGGTGKAEDAKLQDAGISLKQCPEK
jgi:hypothetical protein